MAAQYPKTSCCVFTVLKVFTNNSNIRNNSDMVINNEGVVNINAADTS